MQKLKKKYKLYNSNLHTNYYK